MRAVIYARYSTDLQSAASIEDQVRLCRERLERDGHDLVKIYSDRAISGANPPSARGPTSHAGRHRRRLRSRLRRSS
jgi:DNA invertase Pin-like site-specific DNA recombinase